MACGWDVTYAHCDETSSDALFLESVDGEVRRLAEDSATDYLNLWSGGQFGPCPVTIRPCRDKRRGQSNYALPRQSWTPQLIDGKWYNTACGSCGRTCSCRGPETLRLPGPVHRVLRVEIDGADVPEDAYRTDGNLLIREDGAAWPTYQDRSIPLGRPGTWAVEYERGLPVPAGGTLAASVLALELMKAMCDDDSCRLPRRVETITRQGVSMTMMDAFEGLDEGRTGLWMVDSWLESVRKPRRGGRVYNPDNYVRR